ncbi:rhodanese-like domain-containing protein [uncultured Oscillibacter sp.]|uniref:rhodanese-like domain-containing protein n=1 Tax=uncultured Oscillibacter sp. TaxID=876091 RepID=UPI0025CCA40D|nr:rhodanese-like domain-containing protein [uncultured Oscillibacter sp.]
MKQFFLLALLIVCAAAALKLYTAKAPGGEKQTLTAAEAKARLDSGDPVVVLDVRTQAEYGEGHIPGALCLPNETIGGEAPAALPDKDAEILVYCRSGRRSAEAARKLTELGYTRVFDFGGIQSWPYETTAE